MSSVYRLCVSAAPGGMQEFNMGGPWKMFVYTTAIALKLHCHNKWGFIIIMLSFLLKILMILVKH